MINKLMTKGILTIIILFVITGCGKAEQTKNNELKIELEKYTLPCESGDVCSEVDGNVSQILLYDASVNGNDYNYIILGKNKLLYLYNSKKSEVLKLNGNTNLTKIEDTLDTPLNYKNELIYGNGNYYSIESDGKVKKADFDFEFKYIISYTGDVVHTIDNNNKLAIFISCESDYRTITKNCSENDVWIKLSPNKGTLFDITNAKYANSKLFLTDKNELYPLVLLGIDINPDVKNEYMVFDNVKKYWTWAGTSIVQISNNDIYITTISISKDSWQAKLSIGEELENVYSLYSFYLLLETKSKVYLAKENTSSDTETYDLIEIKELEKYKNRIKGIYGNTGIIYVLLNDGNFYKLNQTE